MDIEEIKKKIKKLEKIIEIIRKQIIFSSKIAKVLVENIKQIEPLGQSWIIDIYKKFNMFEQKYIGLDNFYNFMSKFISKKIMTMYDKLEQKLNLNNKISTRDLSDKKFETGWINDVFSDFLGDSAYSLEENIPRLIEALAEECYEIIEKPLIKEFLTDLKKILNNDDIERGSKVPSRIKTFRRNIINLIKKYNQELKEGEK